MGARDVVLSNGRQTPGHQQDRPGRILGLVERCRAFASDGSNGGTFADRVPERRRRSLMPQAQARFATVNTSSRIEPKGSSERYVCDGIRGTGKVAIMRKLVVIARSRKRRRIHLRLGKLAMRWDARGRSEVMGKAMFDRCVRRTFCEDCGLSSLGMAATPAPGRNGAVPNGFCGQRATSAYQVRRRRRGRPWSLDMGTFAQPPGKIADHRKRPSQGSNYNRYKEACSLDKGAWGQAYRFSIACRGCFPKERVRRIRKAGFYDGFGMNSSQRIEPFETLYHWDLPQSLQDSLGRWQSKRDLRAFANYARLRGRALA